MFLFIYMQQGAASRWKGNLTATFERLLYLRHVTQATPCLLLAPLQVGYECSCRKLGAEPNGYCYVVCTLSYARQATVTATSMYYQRLILHNR